MGQFGAPGTTVDMTGSAGTRGAVPTVARAVPVLAGTASRVLSCTLRCTLVVDAAPQPATKATATAIATTRRPVWHLMTCPFSRRTVTSWHGPAAQAAATVGHLAANGPEILRAAGYEINHVIGLELANRE
jgi:hypothetical protein